MTGNSFWFQDQEFYHNLLFFKFFFSNVDTGIYICKLLFDDSIRTKEYTCTCIVLSACFSFIDIGTNM